MMTARFAVGSVSSLAMAALLLGSASFLLNRPGSASHATPWGDIATLSGSTGAAAQADDKAQLLKLAVLKSSADTGPAASSVAVVDQPAAPAPAEPSVAASVAASPDTAPSAPEPAVAPAQMASVSEQAPVQAAVPVDDTAGTPDADTKSNLVDLNTAPAEALDHIPGVGRVGRSIVAHRPYRSVKDLVTKRVLRTSDYQKIESHVRVD